VTATRVAVLSKAASQIGYAENPYGSNRTKFGAWYGLDGNPWCDMFASWVADQARAADIIGRFAYTPSHANWFKARGQWHTSGPRAGDVVFYDFGLGRISHVGFVEKVIGGYIQTIEGNTDTNGGRTGGQVMRKLRPVNGLIVGYGRPAYATDQQPSPLPRVYDVAQVKELQRLLEVGADGQWGPTTDVWGMRLRTAAYRHTGGGPAKPFREDLVQKVIDTTVDGVWGPKSQAALGAWVKQAQRVLGVTADGAWGPHTDAAFRALREAAHNHY